MLRRPEAPSPSGPNPSSVSKWIRRARWIALLLLTAALTLDAPVGPYLWDLVDDRVDVPWVRDCHGLNSHRGECD
jgi:hypothetical protein